MLRNAAHALNSVKKTERGRVALHDASIQNAYINKIKLKDKLKKAIKTQSLSVHYQPIVDAKSNQISKFEALVRWFDDEYGMVSPGTFIPIAEEFGLIHLVGQFVLERSCKDLAMPIAPDLPILVFQLTARLVNLKPRPTKSNLSLKPLKQLVLITLQSPLR